MEFYMTFDPIRRRNDLMQQRAAALDDANAALEANQQANYSSAMEKVSNLDTELDQLEALINAQARQSAAPRSAAETRELTESRAADLQAGRAITFEASEVRAVLSGRAMNSVTLGTGSIVEPVGAGSVIRDNLPPVSSIIDQVDVVDLTGTGGIWEPFVRSAQTANGGKVTTTAGTLRAASDPTFGMARISPYEASVTSYVDRNISRLSPANYFAKIQSLAMQALRRKVASLIFNGDGQANPDMFGILNAKDKDGNAMYATVEALAGDIDENFLNELYFAYGGDTALGGTGNLYLSKKDLSAIGKVRGTNEKERLFKISPNAGNPNTGVISDGGFVVPYALTSDLKSLSDAAVTGQTLAYGNPKGYMLGLFGGYSIRVSEDYKAGERMLTILGDVMVGGNIVVPDAFVIATVGA